MQKDVAKFGNSDKRGRRRTSIDPFLPHEGFPEPAICSMCQAAYHQKSWSRDPETYRELQTISQVAKVTCPACQKIAADYPEGIVTLTGDYLWKHEKEIRQLVKNEEAKVAERNPLERIISITRENGELIIETTEEKLAAHLGRVVHRAHSGELKINFTGNPDMCRVTWERMA